MPSVRVNLESNVVRTGRVLQVESIFDIPPSERSKLSWEANIPIEDRDWNVGLIVGPSGAGKTTIARHLFGQQIVKGFDWPGDRSLIDAFPEVMPTKDVIGLLTSVGFGTPPAWLRPFHVLSNGEQFRTTMARALAECGDLICVDEFTSVVDRQVAKVASNSVQKAVRAAGRKLVAVSCHYDIIDWLQPDWLFEPHSGEFQWRLLRRRPELQLEIHALDRSAWKVFAKYHYLSNKLKGDARCVGAFIDGRCVAFAAFVHTPHPKTFNILKAHRIVVLPDYQGLGIFQRLNDWIGQWAYERGYRYRIISAHPAVLGACAKSKRWRFYMDGAKGENSSLHAGAASGYKEHYAKTRNLVVKGFEYAPAKEGPHPPRDLAYHRRPTLVERLNWPPVESRAP